MTSQRRQDSLFHLASGSFLAVVASFILIVCATTAEASSILSPKPVQIANAATELKPGASVSVIGTVDAIGFQRYRLEWGRGIAPWGWSSEGIVLTDGGQTQVFENVLGLWDTSAIPIIEADYYSIRLTVESMSGTEVVQTVVYLEPALTSSNWPMWFESSPTLGLAPWSDAAGVLRLAAVSSQNPLPARLWNFAPDGSSLTAIPLVAGVSFPPAVGNFDGQPGDEVLVADGTGLRVFRSDGSDFVLPTGFANVDFAGSTIILEDLNHDSALEALAVGKDTTTGGLYLFAWQQNGQQLNANFPIAIPDYSAPFPPLRQFLVGDIDGDGNQEILIPQRWTPDYFFNIEVFDADGTRRRESTMTFSGRLLGMVLADLDHDGKLALIIAVQDGSSPAKLHVIQPDGSERQRWPITLPRSGNDLALAVGDLDQDKYEEIVVSSGGVLTVLRDDGTSFSADWPGLPGGGVIGQPLIADINGDGLPEILAISYSPMCSYADPICATHVGPAGPQLVALDRYNDVVASWSLHGGNGKVPSEKIVPSVGDFNGDGQTEIAVTYELSSNPVSGESDHAEGAATILSTGAAFHPELNDWPSLYQNSRNTAVLRRQNDVPRMLVLSPAQLDFGEQIVGSTSATEVNVTVSNTGNRPISITGVSIAPDAVNFQQWNDCGSLLREHGTCTIYVRFMPSSRGLHTGTLTVQGDYGAIDPPAVNLTGTGLLKELSLSQPSVDFGTIAAGTIATRQVTISNTGDVPVSFGLLVSSNPNPYAFSQSNDCPSSLPVSSSCTVTVTFGSAESGTLTGTITTLSDAPSELMLQLTGVAQMPQLTTTPATLDFGGQLRHQSSAPKNVTLTNTGSVPFQISSVGSSFDFPIWSDCPSTLLPGASCVVSVSFLPTKRGLDNGTLTISSGVAYQPLFTVSLTGIGQISQLSLSSTSLDFGNQRMNSVSDSLVTVTNTGDVPVSILRSTSSSTDFSSGAPSCTYPISLKVGTSCSLIVDFYPKARGTLSATITLISDAVEPVPTINVTGIGQSVQASFSPASFDFSARSLGSKSPVQPFTVTNDGDLPISISTIYGQTYPYGSQDYWVESNTCGTSLAVGANCIVNVTFTPSARGIRNGSVTMNGNFTGGGPFANVTGSGIAITASLSPASLDFGSRQLNTTSPAQAVTVTNTGDATLTITNLTSLTEFPQTNDCVGTPLAIGASCTILLKFQPTTRGRHPMGISISGNFTGSTPLIYLNGIGQAIAASFSSGSLSFGVQTLNSTSTLKAITLTNSGDLPITISGIASTGDFSQTNNCGTSLALGANCTISVSFSPSARGSRTGVLTVAGDFTGTSPTAALTGTGQAVQAELSKTALDFAGQLLNTDSAKQTVTLTNTGDMNVSITGISATGDFTQTNNCGTSLAVGANCTINVTFRPSVRGLRSGALAIAGNFTGSAPLASLSGNGQAALAEVSPSQLNFGGQLISTSSQSQTVTISNTGDLPITISGVSVAGDFTQTNNCGTSLPVGASCSVSVAFAPVSRGAATGALSVGGNFAGAPLVVSMSGTGQLLQAQVSPTGLSCGARPLNTTSATQAVSISNTGDVPVSLGTISVTGDFSQANNCAASLAPGVSCTVTLAFTPTIRGARSGVLAVGGDVHANVTLDGTGQALLGTIAPTALTFGGQLLNTTSAAQPVVISNTGDLPISITEVTVIGEFAQSSNCGSTLAVGATCIASVTFTPGAIGGRIDSLTVTADALVLPVVSLSGTGVAPAAELSPLSLNFGLQRLNAHSAPQNVTLTNPGTAPLTVRAITTTGEFTQSNTCGSTLAPGAGCTISVVFSPLARGARSGTLSVDSDALGAATVAHLEGSGGAPMVTAAPAEQSFGSQMVNTTSPVRTITLSNDGEFPLTISSVSVTGEFSQNSNCGSTLPGGASCGIQVTFTPAATGNRSGLLSITSDSNPVLAPIPLSGIGTAPSVALSQTSLTYGAQRLDTTAAHQSITVTNNGTAPLTIDGITLSGDFAQSGDCGGTVLPGASCTINVTFTPTARGTRTGALTLNSNAVGTAPSVSLQGSGAAPVAVVSPASVTFGGQLINTASAPQTVSLTNSGELPLQVSSVSISGEYAQVNNCGSLLAPGATCEIQVAFTPVTTGIRPGMLSFTTDSIPGAASVTLSGSGTIPGASFSIGSLSFGSQRVNAGSVAQNLTLTNSGTATLTIAAITIEGDYAQSNNCGLSLAAGTSCTISVMFTPTVRGIRNGTLVLSSNAPSSPSTTLSGTGVVPIASLSPASVSYSVQPVNTTSTTQMVMLTNSGDAALTINAIAVTAEFAQTNNCGVSLAPGASCTINVTFTPTESGNRTGKLTVTDDALAGNIQETSLSGTGIDYSLTASPTSATVNAGNSTNYTVTVTPLGGSFGAAVALTCSNLPAATTCSFSPASITPGNSSVTSNLTVKTTARKKSTGTPAGTYVVSVIGTSGTKPHATSVTLTVQ